MNLQSNYQKDQSPQNPYSKPDPVNSRLVARVYHDRAWDTQGGKTSGMTHYLAYTTESKEYNDNTADQIEFGRLVRVMEAKFTGKYRENRVNTVILYQNWNKGNTQKYDDDGVVIENPPLLKIVFKDNKIDKSEIYIDPKTDFWYDYANSIIDQIEASLIKSLRTR